MHHAPQPQKAGRGSFGPVPADAGAAASACDTITGGVRTAMEKAGPDGVVLCFGSLYSIGAIRDALEEVTQ